jgi:hypothetical protein
LRSARTVLAASARAARAGRLRLALDVLCGRQRVAHIFERVAHAQRRFGDGDD